MTGPERAPGRAPGPIAEQEERPAARTGALRGFWIGRFASAAGSAVTSLAIPFFLTVHLRMDPVQVSVVLTGPLVVTVLSPLYAGVIADLLDRKRVTVVSELARSALLALLALLAAMNVSDLMLLTAVNALIAVAKSVFSASFNAGLPDLLGEERLQAGNARLQTFTTVAETGSGAFGGALLSFLGPVAAFETNSAAYLLSTLGLVATRWPHARRGADDGAGADAGEGPSSGRRIPYLRRVASGFVAVRESPLLSVLLLTSTVANLVIHVTMVALLWLLVRELDYPFLLYSIVLAVGSGGAVVGAMATTRLDSLRGMNAARLQGLSLVLYGLLLIGYGLLWPSSASSFIVACVIDFGIGFCVSTYVIRNMTQQQTAVARERRGAVSSVRSFGTALAGAAGTAAAGALIEISSARVVVLACGGALLVVAVGYGILVRRVGASRAGSGQQRSSGRLEPGGREGGDDPKVV